MSTPNTTHKRLIEWVNGWRQLCQPNGVYWCNGSSQEYQNMLDTAVKEGLAIKLNEKKRPNCYLFRSDPSDVARVENRTFIASERQEDAGPTNNWIDPKELKATMTRTLTWLYSWPNEVFISILDGADWVTESQNKRRKN
jgi:phosphoenolpyruvate carboxykinase (GTP)